MSFVDHETTFVATEYVRRLRAPSVEARMIPQASRATSNGRGGPDGVPRLVWSARTPPPLVQGDDDQIHDCPFRKDDVMHASRHPFARFALIAGFGLAAIAGSGSAFAQTNSSKRIEIRYGDLDLAAASGVERLNARVRSAARRICDTSGMRGVEAKILRDACMSETLARANRDVQLAIAEHADQRLASRDSQVIGVRTR
jgi:UrcA family protein